MVTHRVNVHEGAETEDTAAPAIAVERWEYEVINPLFKRGKEFRKGSIIELDEVTAKAFIEAGDIKKKANSKKVLYVPTNDDSTKETE